MNTSTASSPQQDSSTSTSTSFSSSSSVVLTFENINISDLEAHLERNVVERQKLAISKQEMAVTKQQLDLELQYNAITKELKRKMQLLQQQQQAYQTYPSPTINTAVAASGI